MKSTLDGLHRNILPCFGLVLYSDSEKSNRKFGGTVPFVPWVVIVW